MNKISMRISKSISKAGLSYRELSKLTKIAPSALQRYATGETERIPIDRIEAIANATGVSARYLLGWEEETTNNEFISLFHQLTAEQQNLIISQIKGILASKE